ncbi:MAG: phosphotransferase [Clostridia bacterium]|nr:phosphotransferase [Clostridia bacterium]
MSNTERFIPSEHFPAGTAVPQREDLAGILKKYDIGAADEIELIDSTRGEDDIRLNYIIDKKYVLRFCNPQSMTQTRLEDLSRLVERYRTAGIVCPQFVKDREGTYLNAWNGLRCYLQEYIDLPLASEKDLRDPERLDEELIESVARFAERYKNVDLSETFGMYSLFDLSPFDVPEGIDEKEQNFRMLLDVLRDADAGALAGKLSARHADVRKKLESVYRGLPRCVFQGDENFTNVLIDEEEHFAGLIDFNLAGTEVVVNQLANLAGCDYLEEEKTPVGAEKRLAHAVKGFRDRMTLMFRFYHPDEAERQALVWYAWIVMVSRWPEVCLFRCWIENPDLKDEALELLSLIADLPEACLEIKDRESAT